MPEIWMRLTHIKKQHRIITHCKQDHVFSTALGLACKMPPSPKMNQLWLKANFCSCQDCCQPPLLLTARGITSSWSTCFSPCQQHSDRSWVEIIANVLNINVDRIDSEEGPALGAAILAAVGCKEFNNVKEATDKIVKISKTVKPNPELVSYYDAKYKKFIKIYPTVKDLYTELIQKR